jgi:membrane-associated phospholipid phosphatase
MIAYFPLNRRKSTYNFESNLDKHIPILSIFVIPYMAYFPYLAYAFLSLWNTNAFVPFAVCMILMNIMNAFFWIVFPNGVKRPKVKPETNLLWVLSLIHYYDGDTNGFPSFHVSHTLLVTFFLILGGQHYAFFITMGYLIIISTLFTKQHYIIDVLGGIASFILTLFLYNKLFFLI